MTAPTQTEDQTELADDLTEDARDLLEEGIESRIGDLESLIENASLSPEVLVRIGLRIREAVNLAEWGE
jgi:hypothetical protein